MHAVVLVPSTPQETLELLVVTDLVEHQADLEVAVELETVDLHLSDLALDHLHAARASPRFFRIERIQVTFY